MYYNFYMFLFVHIHNWKSKSLWLCLQRVYDEEVEENIPKTDGPEKQPEQV